MDVINLTWQTALTLFGGHDYGTVLKLAMEAIRTGRVSNLPLQYRRCHATATLRATQH